MQDWQKRHQNSSFILKAKEGQLISIDRVLSYAFQEPKHLAEYARNEFAVGNSDADAAASGVVLNNSCVSPFGADT